MWKSTEIRLSPGFFAVLALWFLSGAGNVMPYVLGAAACHELGHLAVLALFRVPVSAIWLAPMGAVIVAPGQEQLSYGRDLAATLAGAGTNLLTGLAAARLGDAYLFAGANILLAAYNLLPLEGLDGGRALRLLLSWLWEPITAQRICQRVNCIALALLVGGAAALVLSTGGGVFLLVGALGMGLRQFRLAKRAGKRYNKN